MPGNANPPVALQMAASDTVDPGLLIITNPNAPGTQLLLLVTDRSGNPLYQVPQTGGPQFFGLRVGGTEFYTDYGIGLDGAQNPPCIFFPDGTSAGLNIWGGTGAPSTSTVGTANVGDWYLRRDAPLVGANTGLISVTDNLLPLNTLTTLTLQGATTNWGTNNIGTVTDSLGAVQPMSWTGLGANTLTGFSCAASTNAATGGAVTGAPQRIYMCTVASSGLGNAGTWVAFA